MKQSLIGGSARRRKGYFWRKSCFSTRLAYERKITKIIIWSFAQDYGNGVNSAWKDYSSGGGGPNTNYAFDQYDGSDEKQSPSSLSHTSTIPLTTKLVSAHGGGGGGGGGGGNHYAESRSLHRPTATANGGGRHGNMHGRPPPPPTHHHDRAAGTYSLPRPAQQPPNHNGGYYTHRPPNRTSHGGGPSQQASSSDQLQPDFYFMPSQRKYSGEVVRVYVDYNTNPRK